MKMLNFNAPQEALAPQFYRREVDLSKVIAGGFVRNSVLSGMTYGGNDIVPAFVKTRDAVHPLVGMRGIDDDIQNCYGALLDSADTEATRAAIKLVVQPGNTVYVWAPGGRGLDSWLAAKLPEATLIERYIVASTNTTCPLSWKLQGSNDGETWVDLDIITNTEMWSLSTAREEKEFTIPAESRGIYLWYRIYITASNADTMSISTFRLLRPVSVCDKGQLLIDASAAKPLVLSFMDGFAADGVTPVDHTETLSSPLVLSLLDMNERIIEAAETALTSLDIYAVRDSQGSMTIKMEIRSGPIPLFNNNGMTSNIDKGFKVIGVDGAEAPSNAYLKFCRKEQAATGTYLFSRVDGTPFWVDKIITASHNYGYRVYLYVTELDGTVTELANEYSQEGITFNIGRSVREIKYGTGSYGSIYIYTNNPQHKYRISNGKVYQADLNDTNWGAVQKIKIGTCDIRDGEIVNLYIRSAMSMQWITDGNNMSALS